MHSGDAYSLAAAGVSSFQGADTQQCSTFYGAGCALYRDLFLDLDALGAPPSPPPPPMAPLDALTALRPTRIFFAQGLSPNMDLRPALRGDSGVPQSDDPGLRALSEEDGDEVIDAFDDPAVLAACTADTTDTLCETNGRENAVRRKNTHPLS